PRRFSWARREKVALAMNNLTLTDRSGSRSPSRTMKPFWRAWLVLVSLCLPATCPGANPFITSIYTADPSAHVWSDGRLYIYPSRDMDPARGCDLMDLYHVFLTADRVTC